MKTKQEYITERLNCGESDNVRDVFVVKGSSGLVMVKTYKETSWNSSIVIGFAVITKSDLNFLKLKESTKSIPRVNPLVTIEDLFGKSVLIRLGDVFID